MKEELKQRESCDYCLYVITPKMKGVYSIAEVVDDSNKRTDKTIFVCLRCDDGVQPFNDGQWNSLTAVVRMVKCNGSKVFYDLISAANYINK